jgi:hypothetical protein
MEGKAMLAEQEAQAFSEESLLVADIEQVQNEKRSYTLP